MAYVGVVPAALRGITGYANLAAAVTANPGYSYPTTGATYLDANELQIDVAAQLIQNYTAFNPTTSHVDAEKTKLRRASLMNLRGKVIAPKGTGEAPGDIQDNFAWVVAIQSTIAAFPD